ncbi:hypothetical protein EJB05_05242, partial [Eragrostis curvula]
MYNHNGIFQRKPKLYLIVIDDVWSISAWELVKSVLPENSHHSRVITTTRITNVAKSCCSDSEELIYEIKPLNDSDSRGLFMRSIFRSEDDCPLQLEEASNAILKKCGGLPLALITIASLLSTKTKIKEQWERVKNGMGSAREEISIKMKNILLFSYYDLPYYLKTCFMMGGQRHVEFSDVLLDILVSLAAEENFVTVFDGQERDAKNVLGKIRRLSLHHNYRGSEVQQVSSKSMVHVRSVHAFGSSKDVSDNLDFPSVRVLDLEGSSCMQVNGIHKCLQLRYINLSMTGITEVPKEIGDLQHLKTLDMRGSSMKGKLQPSIGSLTRLKHLFASHGSILPDEIMNLRALQVLWAPTVHSVKLVEWLGRQKELRELYMGCIKPDKGKTFGFFGCFDTLVALTRDL